MRNYSCYSSNIFMLKKIDFLQPSSAIYYPKKHRKIKK